jgi:hypothetical protein
MPTLGLISDLPLELGVNNRLGKSISLIAPFFFFGLKLDIIRHISSFLSISSSSRFLRLNSGKDLRSSVCISELVFLPSSGNHYGVATVAVAIYLFIESYEEGMIKISRLIKSLFFMSVFSFSVLRLSLFYTALIFSFSHQRSAIGFNICVFCGVN